MKLSLSCSILTVLAVLCSMALGQTVEAAATPKLYTSSVLGFGAVALGSSSTKNLTIRNTGGIALTIGTPDVSDSDFTVDSSACTTVASASSCVVTVTFAPAAYSATTKIATLTIPSDDPNSPKTVRLRGSCPTPRMAGVPNVLNFGSRKIEGSYSKSFTVRNWGTSPLTIDSITVANDDEENQDFSLSDDTTCEGASLAKGGTCVVWVYFKPVSAGARTGSVTFQHNSGGTSQTATVTLKGTSTGASATSAPAINSFRASPVAIALGNNTTLSWSVANATSVTIDQGVGEVTGSSVDVTPAAAGKIIYTLTASNSYGTKTATATVTVSSEATPAIDPSQFAVSKAASVGTYDPADIDTNTTFDYTVNIDFTANTAGLSTGTAQTITSGAGITLLTVDSTSITVAQTAYGITITSTVSSPVKYSLTGTLAGTLTVQTSNGSYELYLDGVTINGSSGPALNLNSNKKVFIITAPDKTNIMTDQSTRSGLTMKAALFGKGPMVFSGEGTLSITANYKHGIFSNDYIRVRGGTLDVAVTSKNAIQSTNAFIFDDGVLTIDATGTTINDESKGIKVDGSETLGTGKGYVVINGGYITITSVSKAITAAWKVAEDATTPSTADDPNPYVEINNGVITITATGRSYEYYVNGEKINCAPEGIEGKSGLTINNGYLDIYTTDDALNAGNSITINDGYIHAVSSTNDAIDSNGTMTINGGVIVAIGAREPESAFDCDWKTFTVTGGIFVGISGVTSAPSASACTQNAVILGSKPAGTTMALKASDGAVPFAFTIPQSYSTMLLSAPGVETGTRYTVYAGGTVTADYAFNGLYLGGISYSGGTAGSSFIVSSPVTHVGGKIFGQPF
jgi:hypothetical protein